MLAGCMMLLLFISCTDRLPSEVGKSNTPGERIGLGDKAYAKGYYERAGDYYSEVNTYFPYSVEDELGLSKAVEAYYRAGKFDESRIAASKFLVVSGELNYLKGEVGQMNISRENSNFKKEILESRAIQNLSRLSGA